MRREGGDCGIPDPSRARRHRRPFGHYQHLGKTHAAIRNWCALNHHALAGPNWEIYGHWVEEWNQNPAKIRTDIYYLLRNMN